MRLQMEKNTTANGRIVRKTSAASIRIQMETSMTANIRMARNKAAGFI